MIGRPDRCPFRQRQRDRWPVVGVVDVLACGHLVMGVGSRRRHVEAGSDQFVEAIQDLARELWVEAAVLHLHGQAFSQLPARLGEGRLGDQEDGYRVPEEGLTAFPADLGDEDVGIND